MQRVLDPISGRHVISSEPTYQKQILRPVDEDTYYVRRSPSPPPSRTVYVQDRSPSPRTVYVQDRPPSPRTVYVHETLPEPPEPIVYHTRYLPPEPSTVYIHEKAPPPPIIHRPIPTVVQSLPTAATTTTYVEKPPSYHSDAPSASTTHAQTVQRVVYDDRVHPVSEQKYRNNQHWNQRRIVEERAVGDYDHRYRSGVTRKRQCLAILAGILVLLALAGLIVGIYFGIKAAQTQSALNAASTKVRGGYSAGGYYVNGVYVVPVTNRPFNTYLIYGTETPCNPYNNNTVTNQPIYPNCNAVTTRIVQVDNWTTTTVKTVYVYVNGAAGGLQGAARGVTSLHAGCIASVAVVRLLACSQRSIA